MKKILLGLSAILVFITIGIFIHLKLKVKSYNQDIQLKELNSDGEILFDDFGIPHIYASNQEDAFRLLGYVQASDRLFQMEILRRIGSGRLSEILGKDLIPLDKYIRTVGLDENAKRAAFAFESDSNKILKQNVTAFLAGVNQYIKDGPTPVEFEIIGIDKTPFTVTDIYRALGYVGFGFSMELQNEPLFSWINSTLGNQYLDDLSLTTLRSDVKIPVQNQVIDTIDNIDISNNVSAVLEKLPVPIFYGSNSWVISGRKTKSGKVLFANDTHIGFSQPSIWYEAHIETPDLKLYGNFLAGIPFPVIAHNMHHSWGLTIFPADALDLFNETIKDGKVLYKNEWTRLVTRQETILVKGEDPVVFMVTSTPHGPIISDLDKFSTSFSNPVSMWWVANKVTDKKLHALELLSTSNHFDSLKEGAKLIDSPGLNIMYGDIDGNIGWFGSAKLIKRPKHVNSKIILNGSTGIDDPLGFYEFKYNPRNINPESGFIYSANNQPDSVNGYFFPGYYYAGARAKVIAETIAKKDDWDMESMKELVMKDESPIYPDRVKIITALLSTSSSMDKTVLDEINLWSGTHHLTDIGPTIYYKLMYHILNNTLADEMGREKFEIWLKNPTYLHSVGNLLRNEKSVWWDNIHTIGIESRADIFQSAFNQTVLELNEQLGNDITKWTWSKVHFVEHPHPIGKKKPMDALFNVGPIPSSGGEEVINKIAFSLNNKGIYKARSGPAMRILLDFDDIENSISINPTGESGYFMNPHYSDQAQMYVDGIFRKQKMSKPDIQQNTEGVWKFSKNLHD